MITTWKEFKRLQRAGSANQDAWTLQGRTIYGPDDELIAQCSTANLAAQIVLHHAHFSALCNFTVMLASKLSDARTQLKEKYRGSL